MIDAIGDATAATGAVAIGWQCEECSGLTLPLRIVAALGCVRAALVSFRLPLDLTFTHDARGNLPAAATDAGCEHGH